MGFLRDVITIKTDTAINAVIMARADVSGIEGVGLGVGLFDCIGLTCAVGLGVGVAVGVGVGVVVGMAVGVGVTVGG